MLNLIVGHPEKSGGAWAGGEGILFLLLLVVLVLLLLLLVLLPPILAQSVTMLRLHRRVSMLENDVARLEVQGDNHEAFVASIAYLDFE